MVGSGCVVLFDWVVVVVVVGFFGLGSFVETVAAECEAHFSKGEGGR